MPERSPEERERARLEREARRAAREGRAAPPPEPQPAPSVPPPGPRIPRGQDETPAAPPATGRDWRRAAGNPDPDPPNVRRVERPAAREKLHAHGDPLPAPRPAPKPPGRRIPPAPSVDGPDRAIGTKRATFGRRAPAAVRDAEDGARRGRRTAGRAGALLALLGVVFVLWFALSLFQPFTGSGSGNVTLTIPQGASVGQVGDLLAENEVVGSAFFFGLRARLEGKDSELNSGRVELRRGMSYASALDALTQPARAAPRLTKLTLPEGRSREEVAQTLEGELEGDYLAATRASPLLDPRRLGAPRGATLEGFLFPATYDLRPADDVRDLVRKQLQAFKQNLAEVDLRRARRRNLTPYDVVVIASMIEREATLAKERPLISAVIHNRLQDGIPLGIDATLRYELKNWTEPLKVSELEADTPYNTRTNAGLPPGPIGSPGLASLQAAARPADVDFLFYVVKPCGNGAHSFSATDAEFQRDVAAYEAKREELGGKSPVTCK